MAENNGGSKPEDLYHAPDPTGIFELVDLLGEGSYGSVYKGRHIRTGEIVAIKVIDLVEDELLEIWMEINFMRVCKHPNVVKFFGTYLRSEKLWIVMEICQGGSVMDLYKENTKGLKEEQISYICHETLQGLAYLHEKGIIHRDIKCGNILLTGDCDIKLADFGVSGQMSEENPMRHTFIGTPYWMAPEVIACDKDADALYDEKCDVWAVGITAIEMADLDPPLADLHPLRALFLIPANKPPTLAQPRKWSKQFRDFLKQCLIKDPAKRPSAKTLLNHPFIKPKVSTRRARLVLQELVDRIANKGGSAAAPPPPANEPEEEIDFGGDSDNEDSSADNKRKSILHQTLSKTNKRQGVLKGTLGGIGNDVIDMAFPETRPPVLENSYHTKRTVRRDSDASDIITPETLGTWQNLMGRVAGGASSSGGGGNDSSDDDGLVFSNPLYGDDDSPPSTPLPAQADPFAHQRTLLLQMGQHDGSFIFSNPLSPLSKADQTDPDDFSDSDVEFSPLSSGSHSSDSTSTRKNTIRASSNLRSVVSASDDESGGSSSSPASKADQSAPSSSGLAEEGLSSPASKSNGRTYGRKSLRGFSQRLAPAEALIPANPQDASVETAEHLPFSGRATRKGTQRLNAALASMFKEEGERVPSGLAANAAASSPSKSNRIPASAIFNEPEVALNSANNLEVNALSLAKNFPFEIVCATTWGSRYLFGTPYGLYQLDKNGTLTRVIKDTRFTRITVIEEYGVLIAICGRHQHIRMYTLQDLYSKNQKQRRLLRREDSFSKIKGTKYSSHYSIVRSRGAVFMIASVKTTIVLFMWADYPFNKFMKIKDFYAPEKVQRVYPILNSEGKLATLLVQCVSRYFTVDVDSSAPDEIDFKEPKKSVPLLVHPINAAEVLVAFKHFGYIVETATLKPKPVVLNWRFIPLAVVPLHGELILAFGSKMIDVFSKHTGEVLQVIRHKESKKIQYLFNQNDDVLVASRSMKTQNGYFTSNVYIMRASPAGTGAI